ncbi:Peroxisome biogenesis factor 10 [Oopsacas minuta]|uniref:RING-type E3 ubiquitin transferase n=1 Tax=Oopsacas minuta TaxID=111878 RepID=A0AAV7K3C5_9METZ|nr:Peroxisome biogenesis factor 10 [Oopsacas minuta]
MSSHALTLSTAAPAQICRAAQKDQFYQQQLYTQLSELVKAVSGVSFLLRSQRELQLACRILYLSLTTLSSNQTLGEEYCSILLSAPPSGAPPSFLRNLSFLIIESFGPYLLDQTRSLFSRTTPVQAVTQLDISPAICCLCKVLFSSAENIMLALFYTESTYYQISKRILKMRYLWIHAKSQKLPPTLSTTFRLISLLFISQLLIRLLTQYRNESSSLMTELSNLKLHSTADVTSSTDKGTRCVLCLEEINSPSLTPCGHIFCWVCIHNACSSRGECPCCKFSFSPSRIVLLQNYS